MEKNEKKSSQRGKEIQDAYQWCKYKQSHLIPVVTAGIRTRRENCCKYHFGLFKVRSVKSKEQALVNYFTEKYFDIVLMTETWLKPDKDDV